MSWRQNVGQPLFFKGCRLSGNSDVGSESAGGASIHDDTMEVGENQSHEDSDALEETVRAADVIPVDEDFDSEALLADIEAWNDRPSSFGGQGRIQDELDSQLSFESGFSDVVLGAGSETGFEPQPLISSTAMSHLVNKTIAEQSALTGIKMPWACQWTTSAAYVFCSNFPSRGESEAVEMPKEFLDVGINSSANPVYLHAVSNLMDASFEEMKQGKMELAVTKWLCIIQMHMLASSTGRLALNLGRDNYNSDEARRIVAAVIGIRSPTTAISRANALLRYLRWAMSMFGDIYMAFREESVWSYFDSLSTGGAAATTACSLLSALRYAKFIMGYGTFDEILGSKRLKGSADLMFVEKESLKQAKVLTVQQVNQLHKILVNDAAADYDGAAAGYLLLALYGRCRHSDLQNVSEIIHDYSDEGGYLEVRTKCHKTACNALKRTMLLPIILPVLGVDGSCFVRHVGEAFSRVGLPFDGKINGPIFRPPSKSGEPCKRGLTSTECSRFLQLFLDEPSSSVAGEPILTSHGLKATGPSWCSKFGLQPADKSILGRHVSATCESSAVYSRDLSTRSVALFQGIILDIFKGIFSPDAGRRNYFPELPQTGEAHQQPLPAQSEVVDHRVENMANEKPPTSVILIAPILQVIFASPAMRVRKRMSQSNLQLRSLVLAEWNKQMLASRSTRFLGWFTTLTERKARPAMGHRCLHVADVLVPITFRLEVSSSSLSASSAKCERTVMVLSVYEKRCAVCLVFFIDHDCMSFSWRRLFVLCCSHMSRLVYSSLFNVLWHVFQCS